MFGKTNFVESTLGTILTFLKDSIFAAEFASQKGFLQTCEPRIKTISIGLMLLSVLFAKSIAILIGIYLFCLLLAASSLIPMGFFLKRSLVFVPLFSFFIALPALLSKPGVSAAMLFLFRVTTSVSLVTLLGLTTPHSELLRVLQIFKVPAIFVLILGMCYRYIFLFMEIIENTYRAVKSRVGTKIPNNHGQKVVTWNIAHLWQRSYQLNNEVYKAMLSRGYSGEARVLDEFKTNARDWLWLGLVAAIFGFMIFVNYE